MVNLEQWRVTQAPAKLFLEHWRYGALQGSHEGLVEANHGAEEAAILHRGFPPYP